MNCEETSVLASLKQFVKLWGSGSQATFNLECSNGQAWFHLGARLGHPAYPHFYPPNPPPQVPQKRKKTPARIEKDLARAAEHRAKQDNLAVPAQASQSSPAATVGTCSVSPPPTAGSASSTPPLPSANTIPKSVPPADSAVPQTLSSVESSDASADTPIVVVTEAVENQESSHEAFEKVHATAVVKNCPSENCDYKEIYDIVTKEQHRRTNIATVNIDHQSTRRFRTNLFTHTISLVLLVKTGAIWDSPRQYVWKHLGQNDWKTRNGTSIKFVKIHVFRVEVYCLNSYLFSMNL